MRKYHVHLPLLLAILTLSSARCVLPGKSETEFPMAIPQPIPTDGLTASSAATVPLHAIPSAVPKPSTTPTLSAELMGESEEVMIWASSAGASSIKDASGWQADEAVGQPDTLICGNYSTAWAPDDADPAPWIELTFFPPVLPLSVHLIMSFEPTTVSRVELFDLDGTSAGVITTDPEREMECPRRLVIDTPDVDVLIEKIRVTFDRTGAEEWSQLDAAALVGWVGEEIDTAFNTMTVSDTELGFSHYTNGNEVYDLALSGNILWAATGGGVTAWDLISMREIAKYTTLDGLLANDTGAVAVCALPEPAVYAASAEGISVKPLEAPFWKRMEGQPILSGEQPKMLVCDQSHQRLWVGYPSRLRVYDAKTSAWEDYSEITGQPIPDANDLLALENETWVASGSGVFLIQGNGKVRHYAPDNSGMAVETTFAMARDPAGFLWFASTGGLLRFDGNAWKQINYPNNPNFPLANTLTGLKLNPDGQLLVADMVGQVCEFDTEKQDCLRMVPLPGNPWGPLSDLALSPDGQPILSSRWDGIALPVGASVVDLKTDDPAFCNHFEAVAHTPNGFLWVAGETGLQRFLANQPDGQWETVDLQEALPTVLFAASNGLWVGHNQGARFIPYGDGKVIDLSVGAPGQGINSRVTAITVDSQGNTWFGTLAGVTIWDGRVYTYLDLLTPAAKKAGGKPPQVNALLAKRDGGVWIGKNDGLEFTNDDGSQATHWTSMLAQVQDPPVVNALAAGPDGDLLLAVGTQLLRFNGSRFEPLYSTWSDIRTIFVDPYWNVWLASAYDGIVLGQPDSEMGYLWSKMTTADGLPSNRYGAQALTFDYLKTLWLAPREGGLAAYRVLLGQ